MPEKTGTILKRAKESREEKTGVKKWETAAKDIKQCEILAHKEEKNPKVPQNSVK